MGYVYIYIYVCVCMVIANVQVKHDFDKAAEEFAVKVEKRAIERKKENEEKGEKFEPLTQAGPSAEKGEAEEEEGTEKWIRTCT